MGAKSNLGDRVLGEPVACKNGAKEEDFPDLNAARVYHLSSNSFSELERYTEEGICGRIYMSREGKLLHLVRNSATEKISVVESTS